METLGNVVMNEVTEALSNATEVAKEIVPGLGDTLNHPSANAMLATDHPTVDATLPEPTDGSTDDFLSCAYKVDAGDSNVQKMVWLYGNETTVSDVPKMLFKIEVPHQFFASSSYPAYGNSRYFSLVRCGMKAMLEINLPAGSSGAAIMFYLPPPYGSLITSMTDTKFDMDTIMYNPHTIIDVAKNTQCTLVVPYINFTNYMNYRDLNTGGWLIAMELVPIRTAQSSKNQYTWNVYGELLDLDFQAPHIVHDNWASTPEAFNDQGRKIVPKRKPPKVPKSHSDVKHVLVQPGYGALNSSNAVACDRAESISLCNDVSAFDFRTSGCAAAATSVLDVARKWTIIYRNQWIATTTRNTVLHRQKLQFNKGIFKYLADAFSYFRGDIELKVMVFTSKFQKGKYQLSWYPYGTIMGVNPMPASSMRNSVFLVSDASTTGPILRLPFTSASWRRNFSDYGTIVMNVINPLTYVSTTFSGAYFVILMRAAENFEIMCPFYGGYQWVGSSLLGDQDEYPMSVAGSDPIFMPAYHDINKYKSTRQVVPSRSTRMASRLAKQELALDIGPECPTDDEDCDDYVNQSLWEEDEATPFVNYETLNIKTISEGHDLLRNCLGRMTYCTTIVKPQHTNFVARRLPCPYTGAARVTRAFAYWTGELIFATYNRSSKAVLVGHSYIKENTFTHWNQIFSAGAIIIPPNEAKVFKVPFYSPTPFRPTASRDSLGTFHAYLVDGNVDVFVSFRNAQFFHPMMIPTQTAVEGSLYVTDGTDVVGINEGDELKSIEELSLNHENQGLCVGQRKTSKRPLCQDQDNHVTCHYHQFFPVCCVCLDASTFELEPEDCSLEFTDVRPRYYCVKMRESHEQCSYHKGRQMCCKCAQSFGWLDQPERRSFSPTAQEELAKYGIESNPGPYILCHHTLDNKRCGIRIGRYVFEPVGSSLEAILASQVTLTATETSPVWTPISDEVDMQLDLLTHTVDPIKVIIHGHRFNDTSNEVQLAIKKMLLWHAQIEDQALGSTLTTFLHKLSDLIFGNLEETILKLVIRVIVRILCYLVLYMSNPTVVNTGIVGTLVLLDLTSISVDDPLKVMSRALVNGDFHEFCEALLESCQEMDKAALRSTIPTFSAMAKGDLMFADEGKAKDFNDLTSAFKNLTWWLGGLMAAIKWITEKLFPAKMNSKIQWMEDNKEQLTLSLAYADEHLVLMKTDKVYAVSEEAKIKHLRLADMFTGALLQLDGIPSANDLTRRINVVLSKLQSVNFEPEANWSCRPEPLGIWVSGSPGVGKSFFVNYITRLVAKQMNWKIYANPTGSKHMDGYTDQQVHIFDDFGQVKDEQDYTLICNLISSVPFIVPKAEVTTKGTLYNGRLVVATTNRRDFSSCTLWDPEALERRFPYRYTIRPRAQYRLGERLDVAAAMRDGALVNGTAWERNLGFPGVDKWETLDGPTLVQEILDDLTNRRNIAAMMNQGPDKIFEELEMQPLGFDYEQLETNNTVFGPPPPKTKLARYREWVSSAIAASKSFFQKFRKYIEAAATVISILGVIKFLYSHFKQLSQGFYDGDTAVSFLTKDFLIKTRQHNEKLKEKERNNQHDNQGLAEIRHITSRLVNVRGPVGEVTGLALGSKSIVTYAHNSFTHMVAHGESETEVPLCNATKITYDTEPTDLAIYDVDMKYQFKDVNRLIHGDDYRGDGYLVWKHRNNYAIMAVSDIRPGTTITTKQGTKSSRVYVYKARTGAGTCGGVLIGFPNGNPKILGIHTSGNGITGAANRLYPWMNQGQVISITDGAPAYHQPRRTKYGPSPLYFESGVAPAVLSRNDPRLQVEIQDITVKAASKYIGNVFDPPTHVFSLAKTRVLGNLYKVIDKHSTQTYDWAIDSKNLPLDWSTSPGLKYAGSTKRQLVLMTTFKDDVQQQLSNPQTYFTTYLKDELRPLEKIYDGRTRAIEACNFDYTIAYRQVMGPIYGDIYADRECISEVAVGMNPYEDFDTLIHSLYDWNLCLDYKGFDGSLSPELMRAAVDLLSYFHSDPELVKKIHEPTIVSTNLVAGQVWEVDGGMCSGSPCTSVINSICNCLAISTIMISYGIDPADFRLVTYGDDCIISLKQRVDLFDLEWRFKAYFGMTVTNFDKSSTIQWLSPMEISFLKRTPIYLHGSTKIVGALDLGSADDKIQWTKGPVYFEQQLDSYLFEVAIHGQDVYEEKIAAAKELAPNITFPPWELMRDRVRLTCGLF
nr:MAG: polyprotein [Picornaviridae sp.]